ncbi:TPA: hypothetical protein ACGW5B_005309 [Bacillus paranthracis]|uniref:hypothetical protein n=1 Tax=Bacillus cereus group TaxID=86661 RepID=UPI000A8EEC19|nr:MULTISPECIES: hypothetical protein [Bacillus cereus group]MCC2359015.1 hypothetical protein [Bacillus paranthracis]MCU4739765.1 hypothetical protein [Bacillus paranthracis]MCU4869579.1 hypothetical protein [Bacillus paranthracis]MCU5367698.1 hypothetical protein [Bacillus paranthracis]MCU5607567.1 hypothetical protein [Bacillus paranthracis]
MSMYTTAKTWDEMIKVVQSLEPPSCLSVNYDPDNDEYKIWCGNQPYYFYQDEIEKLDDEKRALKKEVKRLRNLVDSLIED